MAGESSLHTLKGTGRECIARGTVEQRMGILPYVGCVCIVDVRLDKSCGGVPSS